MVVSSLLTEAGFESAEKAAVETLTEMLQSCKCFVAQMKLVVNTEVKFRGTGGVLESRKKGTL